jgi:hypothetical protein
LAWIGPLGVELKAFHVHLHPHMHTPHGTSTWCDELPITLVSTHRTALNSEPSMDVIQQPTPVLHCGGKIVHGRAGNSTGELCQICPV